jgi:heparan-alpha-glucosaminide N-acetyltransferase
MPLPLSTIHYMIKLSQRLHSIDAFRALTMLTMIFVNDVSGVSNIPAWIEHVKAADDGLGFADTVFPAFMFIVGLSIPFALGKRILQQKPFAKTFLYILARSLALIVMGFFHVNLESYSAAAPIPYALWEILITVSFFLIWLDYPETMKRSLRYTLTGLGVALLVLMAALYKGGDAEHPHWMQPEWWGILGIIGWAYLVCATLYLLVKGSFAWLAGFLAAFLAINIATHAHVMPFSIPIIEDGNSEALVMGGAVISSLYTLMAAKNKTSRVWLLFALLGIGAIAAGFILRPYTDGISKIRSTPAWVLICSGISILMFEAMIWLVDVKGRQGWYRIIRPAGTSTLTCYLVPYLLYSIFILVHFHFPEVLSEGIGGILRSIAMAFIVILITGVLERARIRLKI